MIKSMTGFGRGKYENEGRTYTVEIKSVNHKYSDISVKLPRFLNSIEDKIRNRIGEVISRGKVDVFVNGLGSGRETAIRSLQTAGLEVSSITDVTPVPHNGCRPPKRPRG